MELLLKQLAESLPPSLAVAGAVYIAVRLEMRAMHSAMMGKLTELIKRISKAEQGIVRLDERTKR